MKVMRKQNPAGYPKRGEHHVYFHLEDEFWHEGFLYRVVPNTNRKIACTHCGMFLGQGEIKPRKQSSGYLWVGFLNKDNKSRNVYCHRAVALCWVENPRGVPFVNHKDGNKHNNNYSNLEWVTAKENTKHAISTGLVKNLPSKGEVGFRTRSQVIQKPTAGIRA